MTTRQNTNTSTIVITALRHALPYLRVYKHKVFVFEGGRRRVRHARGHALVDGADRHPAPGRHPRRRRARRRPAVDARSRNAWDCRRRWSRAGASPTRRRSEIIDDGAERRDQHAHRGRVPRARHSGDRHQRRRRRSHQSDEAPARAGRRPDRRLRFRRRHRSGSTRAFFVKQLDNDLVPIVSPLSADDHGTVLNINADTVAADDRASS